MLLISISTFICIAFGVMAIYWLAFRPASATAVRLRGPRRNARCPRFSRSSTRRSRILRSE
jgi:hypothetical protein